MQPSSISPWLVATALYLGAAVGCFVPVLRALVGRVKREDVERASEIAAQAFDQSRFDDGQKESLKQHFDRLAGTLMFWKNTARKYRMFHYYCLIVTIPSAVVVPILSQGISNDRWSKGLVTVVSGFTACLLALHRGFKVEDNYKAFRHGESEYYDLYRRLLDDPEPSGEKRDLQIRKYFDDTETIRRFVRNAETSNLATLDEAKQILQGAKNRRSAQGK